MTPILLKHRRTALNLTQSDLAELTGVTPSMIDLAEREDLSEDVTFLLNLAVSLLEAG